MRIKLKEIKDFSQCPRYYHYNKVERPDSFYISVFNFILKRCHMQATETGYRTNWRTIVGWVDSQVFADIDLDNKEVFEQAKKNSEYILIALQKWYKKYYLKESYDSYIDIHLWERAGDHYIGGCLPLVQINESPIITLIQDVPLISLEVYNNIMIRGLIHMAITTLETSSATIRLFILGSQGGLDMLEQTVDAKASNRSWKSITEIAHLIAKKVNYVSRTDHCKGCTFLRRCKL